MLAKELNITSAKTLDIAYSDFKQQSPANLHYRRRRRRKTFKLFPDASQKVGDYVDMSLLDALKNEGFFTAMEQKYKTQ